jgi:hypothetical protein
LTVPLARCACFGWTETRWWTCLMGDEPCCQVHVLARGSATSAEVDLIFGVALERPTRYGGWLAGARG